MLGVFPGVGSPGRSGCHGRRSASTRGWRTVPRNPRRVRRRSRSWIRSNGWSTSGRVADRFMPRIAASYGQARVRLAGRRAGVRRLVSDRAAVRETLEAGAPTAGRGVLGAGVVAGRDAGGVSGWRRPWWRGAGRMCIVWSSRSRIRIMRYTVALPGENAECVRRGAARDL